MCSIFVYFYHHCCTDREFVIDRDGQCCNLGLGEKEDSSLAQLLRDTDPTITGGQGRNLNLDNSPGTQRNQYQQSKFLDGGGNFVDPNKVLPGHFARKGTGDVHCSVLYFVLGFV